MEHFDKKCYFPFCCIIMLLCFCIIGCNQIYLESMQSPETGSHIMGDEDTEKIEQEFVRLFSKSEKVAFVFHASGREIVCIVTDKRVLSKFAKHFRFSEPTSYSILSGAVPGRAISVTVGFTERTKFGLFSGDIFFRDAGFTINDGRKTMWASTRLSDEFQLLFNYYFLKVIHQLELQRDRNREQRIFEYFAERDPEHYSSRIEQWQSSRVDLSFDDYKRSFIEGLNDDQKSFLEDVAKIVRFYQGDIPCSED